MKRKTWMKELKAYRFNRHGTMTQETQRDHTKANRDHTPSARMGEQVIGDYAKALGISAKEACERVNKQRESE